MTTHLWRHQQEAFDFINPLGSGMLAMGMGSGKSATAVALLEEWQCRRTLILCPKSVAQVWPGQFEQHAGQDWHVLTLDTGSITERTERMRHVLGTSRDCPLAVVLNYDACTYEPIKGALTKASWDALIMDECHRLKQPSGKQSRFVGRLAKSVPHRLGLTGTPMPHSPLDIYAQFRAIWPPLFGHTNTAFKARYAVYGGYQGQQVVAYRNLEDLNWRMYQVTYRCRTEDVLDLPPFTDIERYCELGPETARAYRELRDELITELDADTITADNALVKLLRLAQIANGFVRTDDDAVISVGTEKANLLSEVLDDLRADYDQAQEPMVVFARFHHDLDTVHAVSSECGLRSCELSGRRNELAKWQGLRPTGIVGKWEHYAPEADVLAVQLQSGGVGIDLTRARYAIYYSQEFSLGNYDQSRARVHRPGQERPVTYVHLVARGTVDQTIRKALERKADIVRFVIDELRGVEHGRGIGAQAHPSGGRGEGPRSTPQSLEGAARRLGAGIAQ
jgi:SNF2 family DNA or RNA helicase